MNTNKKILLALSIILLLICSTLVVDASVLTGAHEYVGENICAEDSVLRILRLVGYIVIIVKVLVPLLLIVMGTIDLFKATVGKDEKELTKSLKSLMLRIALGVFIFFIPSLVNWAFDMFNENSGGDSTNACVTCVLDPGNC